MRLDENDVEDCPGSFTKGGGYQGGRRRCVRVRVDDRVFVIYYNLWISMNKWMMRPAVGMQVAAEA